MSKKVLIILIAFLVITGSLYIRELQKEINEEGEIGVLDANLEKEKIDDEKVSLSEKDEIIHENDSRQDENKESDKIGQLVDCLEEKNMVIYGSKTCPACANLADSFGGYDKIEQIYVECTDDWDRCQSEKKTGYVPEIQIDGELYEEGRSLSLLASYVGCEF